MRSFLLSLVFVVALGSTSCGTPPCSGPGCVGAGGGSATTGGGDGAGGGSAATGGGSAVTGGGSAGTGGGAPFTCTRTTLECQDQAIQELDLQSNAAPGLITNEANGTGFKSTVDATAGGFPPSQGYVYARFTASGLEKLPLDDVSALDSMDWDIAFRRFVIRINSGDSGPSCVKAQSLASGTTYSSVTAVPANFLPEADDFLTKAPACTFVDDGKGLTTSPRTYLSTFYRYANGSSCVGMTGLVYVLQTQTGRHVKLKVNTYYATEAAQQACDSTGSPGAAGGTIRLLWQYLD